MERYKTNFKTVSDYFQPNFEAKCYVFRAFDQAVIFHLQEFTFSLAFILKSVKQKVKTKLKNYLVKLLVFFWTNLMKF